MKVLENHINDLISLKVGGEKKPLNGIIIDAGNDVLVVYDGYDFVYISSHHIHDYQFIVPKDDEGLVMPDNIDMPDKVESISLRKVMEKARGLYTEIYLTGSQSMHGYITSVMNDYFSFYSPIHHSVYCSLKHLKWIKPYQASETPYGLDKSQLPFLPADTSLSRTFSDFVKKAKGRLVILDLGEAPHRVGKMDQVQNNLVEIRMGRRQKSYVNIHHIKTLSFP